MAKLHLMKLCVGADSVADHEAWIQSMLARKASLGLPREQLHTTRMMPKRKEELLECGSLYWVTKGVMQSRQKILDIRPFKDEMGVKRCHIVLEPQIIHTRPQSRRAFQGWRYLKVQDAPEDINLDSSHEGLSPSSPMYKKLVELGLL